MPVRLRHPKLPGREITVPSERVAAVVAESGWRPVKPAARPKPPADAAELEPEIPAD